MGVAVPLLPLSGIFLNKLQLKEAHMKCVIYPKVYQYILQTRIVPFW